MIPHDKLKAGLQIAFTESAMDVTAGKVYVIEGRDRDGDWYFIDDAGDENFSIGPGGNLDMHAYPHNIDDLKKGCGDQHIKVSQLIDAIDMAMMTREVLIPEALYHGGGYESREITYVDADRLISNLKTMFDLK